MKMKVAFLSFQTAEYCIRLASSLAKEIDILLLLPAAEAHPHSYLLDPNVKFYPFHKPRLRQPWQQIKMVAQILQTIRDFDPHVVHLQQGHLWFNPALLLLRKYPLVLTIHDPFPHLGDRDSQKTPQWIFDFGSIRAGHIIVHAHPLKLSVAQKLHIPEERIHVVPTVERGDDRGQKHVDVDENMILFFGRIWKYKGLEYLIRAEPLITARIPQARIVIAGQGEDFTRYRNMMTHPERFTVYNEFISEGKKTNLFQQASVVALPYIEATQSGVIPIAYKFSKPVVATRVGGLPELVEDGQTGYLVPPADEYALAEAIIRILQDPALRSQMGAKARKKLAKENSAVVVAQKTLMVYRHACRTMHPDRRPQQADSRDGTIPAHGPKNPYSRS